MFICRPFHKIFLSIFFFYLFVQEGRSQLTVIDSLFCRNILSGNLDSVKLCLAKGAKLSAFATGDDSASFILPGYICIAYSDTNCLSQLIKYGLGETESFRSTALRFAVAFNNLPVAAYLMRAHYPLLIHPEDCESQISIQIETMKSEKELKENFSNELEELRRIFQVRQISQTRKNFNHVEGVVRYNVELSEMLRAYQPTSFSTASCPVLKQLSDDDQTELRSELQLAQYLEQNVREQFDDPENQSILSRIAIAAGDHALLSTVSKKTANSASPTYRKNLLIDILFHGSVSDLIVLGKNGYNLSEEFDEAGYYLIDALQSYLAEHRLTKAIATVADYFINHGYSISRKKQKLQTPLESFCSETYRDSSEAAYDLLTSLSVAIDSSSFNKSLLHLYATQQSKGFNYLLQSRDSIPLYYPPLFREACKRGDEKLLTILLREIKDPLSFDFADHGNDGELSDLTIYYYTLLYLKSDLLNNQHFYPTPVIFEDSLKYLVTTNTNLNKFQGYLIQQFQDKANKELMPSIYRPDKMYYKETDPKWLEKHIGCRITDGQAAYPVVNYSHHVETSPAFIDLSLPELALPSFQRAFTKANIYFDLNAFVVIPQLIFDFANPLVFPSAIVSNNSKSEFPLIVEQNNLLSTLAKGESKTFDRTKGQIRVSYSAVIGTQINLKVDIRLNSSPFETTVFGELPSEASQKFDDVRRFRVYQQLYAWKRQYNGLLDSLAYLDYNVAKNIISKKVHLMGYVSYLSSVLKTLANRMGQYKESMVQLMKFSFENDVITNDQLPELRNTITAYLVDTTIKKSKAEADNLKLLLTSLTATGENLDKSSILLNDFKETYFKLIDQDIRLFQKDILELAQFYTGDELDRVIKNDIVQGNNIRKAFYKGSIFIRPSDVSERGKNILNYIK
jgi:hypothetical protein